MCMYARCFPNESVLQDYTVVHGSNLDVIRLGWRNTQGNSWIKKGGHTNLFQASADYEDKAVSHIACTALGMKHKVKKYPVVLNLLRITYSE